MKHNYSLKVLLLVAAGFLSFVAMRNNQAEEKAKEVAYDIWQPNNISEEEFVKILKRSYNGIRGYDLVYHIDERGWEAIKNNEVSLDVILYRISFIYENLTN